jgi:hypothetical protein
MCRLRDGVARVKTFTFGSRWSERSLGAQKMLQKELAAQRGTPV